MKEKLKDNANASINLFLYKNNNNSVSTIIDELRSASDQSVTSNHTKRSAI